MTVPLKTTEFMLQLHHEIVDKKKVAESTASNYVKALYMLNNKVPFKTLTFLKDTEHIMKVISEYADSTQKTILTGLASVLSLMKDKPTYKRVYQFYYDQMMGKAKEMKEGGPESGQKTEKQKENWVEWEHVQHKRDEMGKEVRSSLIRRLLLLSSLAICCLILFYHYILPFSPDETKTIWTCM